MGTWTEAQYKRPESRAWPRHAHTPGWACLAALLSRGFALSLGNSAPELAVKFLQPSDPKFPLLWKSCGLFFFYVSGEENVLKFFCGNELEN